ncbi:hypothetical protein PoB_005169300 [Plakobranchus ocellatus]|uniref:Peptidase A2 domain-containing protein n=1 Tax=Plakobranchus ocellatus TaxID=259542 RepID=A0AAV4C184_9GAST|nr:hypothetical protein PoB_005169300 [Plakobranchus ocellatus]
MIWAVPGYGNSLRCNASSCQVVDTNCLDPPCGMDSAPDYATSAPLFREPEFSQSPHAPACQVVNPNSLDPPCDVDSALAASVPAFCEKQPTVQSGISTPLHMEAVPAYTVPLSIGNTCVEATVDTAAEVSVVSDEIYRSLSPKLKLLGKRQRASLLLRGPVHIKIGPLSTQELI